MLGMVCLASAPAWAGRAGFGTPALPVPSVGADFRGGGGAGQPKTNVLKLLVGDARQQLVATARLTNGTLRDLTRCVSYEVSPANIVEVTSNGRVTPVADGHATITAKSAEGVAASVEVEVQHVGGSVPVNFPNQIVPIFTKSGCNGGGCHGKSAGQNGFRLSLLGFEPAGAYGDTAK